MSTGDGAAIPVDLTAFSSTFPELPEPQIRRDNLVEFLRDRFGPEQKVIAVRGPIGSGKTTLLAQFAKAFPSRSFSYFAGTTLPSADPRYFLLDVIEQMARFLGRETQGKERLSQDGLKQVFLDLHRQVAYEARKAKEPVYFIVDGLEWIRRDLQEQQITDLIPAEPAANTRLLLSCAKGFEPTFRCDCWDIIFFSPQDTLVYLTGIGLNEDEIQKIYEFSKGVPGYLAAIRRLAVNGTKFADLPSRLPTELTGIFRIEWERAQISNSEEAIVALIAFAKEPLPGGAIAEMSGVSIDVVHSIIGRVSFLQLDARTSTISFISDAFKEFAGRQLLDHQSQSEERLIDFYFKSPLDKSSLAILPAYLATPSRYPRLQKLVSRDYLVRSLGAGQHVSLIRTTLKQAATQAAAVGDWENLYRFALASSILKTVATKPVAEGEVGALLELREFDQALDLAYQAILTEDRLQLLALVASRMQRGNLSVPEIVISELEQMSKIVNPVGLGDRAFEIAALLFEVLPETALDFVGRFARGRSGERAVDWARALLAIVLEDDKKGLAKSRITDPTVQDFVRANSQRVGRLEPDEVIAEVDRVSNTSAKLQILTSWCNANRENPRAFQVIEKALEVITADPKYGTPMRQLRQLTEPLKNNSTTEAARLVQRIEILKETAIKRPLEEVVRLELLLAAVEKQNQFGKGIYRLFETYLGLDQISDLDVRCYCIVRVLIALNDVAPDDRAFHEEALERLVSEFQLLLSNSADHFDVTRRILRALTGYDPLMALTFARLLNLRYRRDGAFEEILRTYPREHAASFDTAFVDEVLDAIKDLDIRDAAIVRLVRDLSENNLLIKDPSTHRYLEVISKMRDPWDRCYALAYALKAIAGSPLSEMTATLEQRVESDLEQEDSEWNRVTLYFDVARIIASSKPDLARDLIHRAKSNLASNPLAEKFFAKLYVNSLLLALRALPGVLRHDPDWEEKVSQLTSAIHRIPSRSVQALLLAHLALRHSLGGKADEFQRIARDEVLPRLEQAPNEYARAEAIEDTGACMFEYEPETYFNSLTHLTIPRRNISLSETGKYVLSGKLRYDPVDLDRLRAEVDVRGTRRVMQLISAMNEDMPIVDLLDDLVSVLVQKDLNKPPREVCIPLVERNALDVARQLEEIVSKKLPDPENIRHSGYAIVGKAAALRLRAAAAWRATQSLPWTELVGEAQSVPNVADRVFILAEIAKRMHPSNPKVAMTLLKQAEQLVPAIPSAIDRADRLHVIAQAYSQIDQSDSAKELVRTAMTMLKDWRWNGSRERLTEEILQLAHSIEPEFASGLTPLIDSPVVAHHARIQLMGRGYQRDPKRLGQDVNVDQEDQAAALSTAARLMLEALNSGVGQLRHPNDVADWILRTVDLEFDDFHQVGAWAIQNTLQQTRQPETLVGLFRAILDCVHLCWEIGGTLFGLRADTSRVMQVGRPGDLKLFTAGKKKEAVLTVSDWLREEPEGYVKIYDPYFRAEDLVYVRDIHRDTRVYIVTSWRAQTGLQPGDRSVESIWRNAWKEYSDSTPPWTQVTIVGTKTGDSPIHSRFLLTKGVGLGLGSSLGGLGDKDTDIRTLSEDEVLAIERDFVDPLLGPREHLYKGQPLIVHVFIL